MSKVNLDALIPRVDFTLTKSNQSTSPININPLMFVHLLKEREDNNVGSLLNLFVKPDFQRETNEWDKKE